MRVLLVKCHKNTIFSKIEPIVTEPLELEYLSTILNKMGIEHRIYDSLLEGISFEKTFRNYKPDILLLSGYITALGKIIDVSKFAKEENNKIQVIVGGVHAEVNYDDFFVDTIDIIIHSDGINTLEKVLESDFDIEKLSSIKGITFKKAGKWMVNDKINTSLSTMPLPNRDYFEKHKKRTKYLNYSPIAIVKTSLSCPFNCSFCYCKLLNKGIYSVRDIDSVIEEIKGICSEHIWIVDDSFLISRERILYFIESIKKNNINKKFIIYSRVDFIANNGDIINKLADIGVVEIIVGMEAVDDRILDNFNKNCLSDDNVKAVKILRDNNIRLTALFIVDIDFTLKDFKKMRKWIRKMKLSSYTVSIFTPIKGTEIYKEYEGKIFTRDYSKWDFLHLTVKPTKMSVTMFYIQFYLIYVEQFFLSKYIRKFILKSWKNIFRFGGSNE